MNIYLASGVSRCYGFQHGHQWQYGPQIPTWFHLAAQTMGIHIDSSGNMDHGHQHGLWLQQIPRPSHGSQHQHESWSSWWPQVVARLLTSAWPPVASWPPSINMALCGVTDHEHPCGHQHGPQHELRWQYRPWTPTWYLVVTQATDNNMTWRSSRTIDSDTNMA